MKPFVLRPQTVSVWFLYGVAALVVAGGLTGGVRLPGFVEVPIGIGVAVFIWVWSEVMRVDASGFTYRTYVRQAGFDGAKVRYAWDEIEDVMLSETRPPFVYVRLRDGTTTSDVTIPPKRVARLTRAVEGFGGRPVKTP